MQIVKQFENKLLSRNEVTAKLNEDGATISRADAKAKLAKALKVEENLIIVKEVKSHYGDASVSIIANVYESIEAMNKNAKEHLVKRNTAPKAEE